MTSSENRTPLKDHRAFWKSTKLLKISAYGAITLCAVTVLGLHLFMTFSFKSVPEIEQAPPTDLIAVLAGGKGRIKQSLDLIAQGRSKKLLIVGADPSATLEKIIPTKDWPVGVAKELVRLEQESVSTFENAVKIREFVLSEHVRDVTVVTSFYHALRTKMILTKMLPRWTHTTVVGVSTENFRKDHFWSHPLSIRLAFEEGVKFIWYWIAIPQIL